MRDRRYHKLIRRQNFTGRYGISQLVWPCVVLRSATKKAVPLEQPEMNEQLPAPLHPPTSNPNRSPASFIIALSRAFDNHDWQTITNYTISGSVNYFGHLRVSNAFIWQDMQGDARTYASDRSTVYPETFTHEVSDEYSSHWDGPMIYDSITVYTEALENNGRLHRARTRLTVGYTVQDQHISIYALVLKVLQFATAGRNFEIVTKMAPGLNLRIQVANAGS